jgi:histone H3/H4
LLAQITGLDEATIRRGQRELAAGLPDAPIKRVRRAGGGRRPVEKKIPPS